MIWCYGRPKEGLRRNRARCKLCGTVLESKSPPTKAIQCQCGNLAIEGGTSYRGRGWGTKGPQYEEMSES